MTVGTLFSHWSAIRRGLLEVIGRFEDEELAYAPFAGSWSVAEIVLHIAEAEELGALGYQVFERDYQLSPLPRHSELPSPVECQLLDAIRRVDK